MWGAGHIKASGKSRTGFYCDVNPAGVERNMKTVLSLGQQTGRFQFSVPKFSKKKNIILSTTAAFYLRKPLVGPLAFPY